MTEPLKAAKIKDGVYRVKDGITREYEPFDLSKLLAKVIVALFAAWIIVGLTSCVVQDGVKIYQTVTTAAK